LAFNNWKFAWLNWPFTLTLCAFNALLGLMLALGSAGNGTGNEPGRVAQDLSSPFGALADAPAVAVLWVALLGILIVFADYRRRWKKWALGLAHGAIQFLGWALACSLAAASVRLLPAGSLPYWAEILALAAAIGVFGGAVFSVVFGFYLMASVLILKRHSNEAFSSLRIEDFKNLLRLELRPDGLTIHAIAVPKVPDTRRSSAGAPAEVRLIERVFLKA